MFNLILFEPQIPPNTGNIIRLCANSGATLHLIQPMGFSMDEKSLRRAGLDYGQLTCVKEYQNFDDLLTSLKPERIFAVSTKGAKSYSTIKYQAGDALLFGSETRGLPMHIRQGDFIDELITIPMQAGSRSLNLSNSVAIVLYEAWRQHDFMLK